MVCVDSTAVGRATHSTPMAEITGRATVTEQRPRQEMSCRVTIRFIGKNLLLKGYSMPYTMAIARTGMKSRARENAGLKS